MNRKLISNPDGLCNIRGWRGRGVIVDAMRRNRQGVTPMKTSRRSDTCIKRSCTRMRGVLRMYMYETIHLRRAEEIWLVLLMSKRYIFFSGAHLKKALMLWTRIHLLFGMSDLLESCLKKHMSKDKVYWKDSCCWREVSC